MPQIPKATIRSIVTLFVKKRAVGTAFVLHYVDLECIYLNFYYLITCDHCVGERVQARFANGTIIDIEPGDWCKPPSGDDVAALDVTDLIANTMDANGSISSAPIVVQDDPHLGIGSDIYMLGLLLDVPDIGRNVPRARFGNLSAFADDDVLLDLAFGFVEALNYDHWGLPDFSPLDIGEPDKTLLSPLRLLSILALVFLVFTSPAMERLSASPVMRPFVSSGRHSLEVFSLGCLLAYASRLAFIAFGTGWPLQVGLNVIGIGFTFAAASYLDRRQARAKGRIPG